MTGEGLRGDARGLDGLLARPGLPGPGLRHRACEAAVLELAFRGLGARAAPQRRARGQRRLDARLGEARLPRRPASARSARAACPVAAHATSASTRPTGAAIRSRRDRSASSAAAASSSADSSLPSELQRSGERLPRRQHAREEVAVLADAAQHLVHRERGRVERLVTSSQASGVETGAPARGRTE